MKHLPNILTWLRLLAAPVLVGVFAAGGEWRDAAAAALFAAFALTDWVDGYVARRFNSASRFGAFLDPVADKIFVVAALLVLLEAGRAPLVVALILIGREIAILALREWLAGQNRSASAAPSLLGKCKTACQMTAITLLFYHNDLLGLPVATIGAAALWLAAALSLLSLMQYIRRAGLMAGGA